jgi:hypothetical protein
MQKAGTAWYYSLTNDLLKAGGFHDANEIREKFDLHSILKFNVCNVQQPTREKLDILTTPPVGDYTFAVKTHWPPSGYILKLFHEGRLKATYIYRDPRDAAVSAFEAGRKLREKGIFERFGKLQTLEDAVMKTYKWLKTWEKWHQVKDQALLMRYEDLLLDPLPQLKRLCDFLGIEVENSAITDIIEWWQPEQFLSRDDIHLHFNKGKIGRFRETMGEKELELCSEKFGPYLPKMGYQHFSPGLDL